MELDANNGIIHFKSRPGYFNQERSGAKPNTLRVVTPDEYYALAGTLPETIMITNPATGESFRRAISSIITVPKSLGITVAYGAVLILISWRQ